MLNDDSDNGHLTLLLMFWECFQLFPIMHNVGFGVNCITMLFIATYFINIFDIKNGWLILPISVNGSWELPSFFSLNYYCLIV